MIPCKECLKYPICIWSKKTMNNCKGCNSDKHCAYTEYSNDCPCSKCLVKVICLDICDELLEFNSNYHMKTMKGMNLNEPIRDRMEKYGALLMKSRG